MYDRYFIKYLGQKLQEYFNLETKLPKELEVLLSKLPNRPNAGESKRSDDPRLHTL